MTGEAGKRRLWRRAGCGGTGGNGGGTVGARRLVPTRRRGRAWGVPGLTEPGGRDGAGGDERELEGWGGGMVGRAGAGRLAVEEVKQEKLGVHMFVYITCSYSSIWAFVHSLGGAAEWNGVSLSTVGPHHESAPWWSSSVV